MVKDLSRIYSNLVSEKINELPAPMQMSEYVKYLEDAKTKDDYKAQEEFWIKKLSPPLKTADLPVDKLRSSIRSFSGTRISSSIDGKLLNSIRDIGNKNRNTFFTTMISAYAVLLSKLTNSQDIITGIPAAGQQVVGADDLIGHCTNLLPLRFDVDSEKSFNQFLSEVKSIVLDAYENQQVSYGDILAKLKIKRVAGRIPLLSTMFNIDPAIIGLKFADLECEMIATPRTGYQFEMGFNLVNSDTECVIECDYNTDLFSEKTIFKFIKYYINILEQVVENVEVKLKDIKILSNEDMMNLMNIINNNNN
jgi:non-ribosomal peptide synthetase component F